MTTRRLSLGLVYLALLVGGFWLSAVLHGLLVAAEASRLATGMIVLGAVAYVGLTAIPFVPGAEIGVALLMVMGPSGAALVYFGMIAALGIAFAAGRFVPLRWVAGLLGSLGFERARDLVLTSGEMSYADRTRFIETHAPRRWVPFLLRNRYIALALLLNLPGNVVLGGGGGIAFAAGACRLFGGWAFLLTILIAVAPIPLAVLLFGTGGWLVRP